MKGYYSAFSPPWAYLWGKGETGGNFCPEKHYQIMEVPAICALGETMKKLSEIKKRLKRL